MGHWLGRNIPNQGARMTQQSINGGMDRLLTPLDAAAFLCVSLSWLARARMRGDGPPFVKIGRAIRYPGSALHQWTKSQMHLSTSEQ
jgi:predicted DNA-binding transcriptional regulator AlpA